MEMKWASASVAILVVGIASLTNSALAFPTGNIVPGSFEKHASLHPSLNEEEKLNRYFDSFNFRSPFSTALDSFSYYKEEAAAAAAARLTYIGKESLDASPPAATRLKHIYLTPTTSNNPEKYNEKPLSTSPQADAAASSIVSSRGSSSSSSGGKKSSNLIQIGSRFRFPRSERRDSRSLVGGQQLLSLQDHSISYNRDWRPYIDEYEAHQKLEQERNALNHGKHPILNHISSRKSNNSRKEKSPRWGSSSSSRP